MPKQRPVRKRVPRNEVLPQKKEQKESKTKSRNGEIKALLLFALSIMLGIALVTFDIGDTGVNNRQNSGEIVNALGRIGALMSSVLIEAFGAASFILPVLFFSFGIIAFRAKQNVSIYKMMGIAIALVLCSLLSASTNFVVAEEKAGGIVGSFLLSSLSTWFGTFGVTIIVLCLIPILVKLLYEISLIGLFFSSVAFVFSSIAKAIMFIPNQIGKILFEKKMERLYLEQQDNEDVIEDFLLENVEEEKTNKQHIPDRKKKSLRSSLTRYLGIKDADGKQEEAVFDDLLVMENYDVENTTPTPILSPLALRSKSSVVAEEEDMQRLPSYPIDKKKGEPQKKDEEYILFPEQSATINEEEVILPKANLLTTAPKDTMTPEEKTRIKETGEKIISCLEEFKVKADLVGFTPGPVVTQYEIRPHPGVRVNSIKNLGDDIALKLEAVSVRVQAPIPGTDLIGIEVPNKKLLTVYFQDLINSKSFEKEQSLLTMALGKTTSGEPFFADLAQMPHLLIAGSTGAGKSVCLNSIILSILYKASPREVQFLLIDPKRVELQAYQDLPHLVHPVVTQMDLARSALQWAVEEMERRYANMELMTCKDIVDYNAKVRRIVATHTERKDALKEFPYLVILIDELADLILTATKEVETNLTRLSQLARACGIHLILATQRPSVDVVTALIKANFPSRIAFRVTSRHDSSTILDAVGAEKLLGKGDMLFKTTHVQRIHGAYVSTDEIEAVVDYWKSKERPQYTIDFSKWHNEKMAHSSQGLFADENDPKYQEAVRFVRERGEVSISLVQRGINVGFNRAARYVEQMEQDGIIENIGNSKKRVVQN